MLVEFVAACLGAALYLTPTFIAWHRKLLIARRIAAINVFLGWTVIGWFVALGLAIKSTEVNTAVHASNWSNVSLPRILPGRNTRLGTTNLCLTCGNQIVEDEHHCQYSGD